MYPKILVPAPQCMPYTRALVDLRIAESGTAGGQR
jgi:hypothetical protein